MVADAESSDSMAGSSRSAAEKHVDRCLDKRAQEKAPKKNHKAEREKLKRDQLNDLFVELSSMLDHDRQNSGKATVLGDAARVLRDLITQVESLRKEQSTLLTECQYVGSEKTELQDENTTLKAQIIELQNELGARIRKNNLNLSSLGVSHPIGSSCTANLATHPTRHDIWSNTSNVSTMRMVPPTNTLPPVQNQQHHSVVSGQVASRPQELQLFPGTTASSDRECSGYRSNPATSSSLADSLPGQLRLSLPPTSQEESSSSGASGNSPSVN
ncbi:transcription factor BHLH062-like isoform X1 [Hordeum vulgare subsp. vulgare]|uniref:BHLH domain-containing protein n=1 Tax=Hordeum vulgare subsp. vulgare TaxID=112509 RepID=A0A8I6XYZ1_HORVV|nr:transcription factor BHLH062-like isoform X1 [Hordeum vulgare subsp. vulgare]XP_044981214.1 transcription factor BHLH062-like isoform X1 [Hordeum vulgare subsp. vulgare]